MHPEDITVLSDAAGLWVLRCDEIPLPLSGHGRCFNHLVGFRIGRRLGITIPAWRVVGYGDKLWLASAITPTSRHVRPADFADGFANAATLPSIMVVDLWVGYPRIPHGLRVADRQIVVVNYEQLSALTGDARLDDPEYQLGFRPHELVMAVAGRYAGLWSSPAPPPALLDAAAQCVEVKPDELRAILGDDMPEAWTLAPADLDQALSRLLDRQARLPELLTAGWQAWQRAMLASR